MAEIEEYENLVGAAVNWRYARLFTEVMSNRWHTRLHWLLLKI